MGKLFTAVYLEMAIPHRQDKGNRKSVRDRQTLGCLGSCLYGALSTNFTLYLICQPYYLSFILNSTKDAYISIQLKNLRKMEE